MDEILEILRKDARVTPEEIAKMTGRQASRVKSFIKKREKDGTILKYKTVLNTEIVRDPARDVRALIEVQVMPQKDVGFDQVAERIYNFPEVTSCYLLSGTYDLLLVVEGKDIHAVASFVAEKLSPMENVKGTVTHFLLKKYKEDGDVLKHPAKEKRLAITY